MRILGIDPGTATTGFGVIETDGAKPKFIDGRDSAIDGFESGRSYVRVAILFLGDR